MTKERYAEIRAEIQRLRYVEKPTTVFGGFPALDAFIDIWTAQEREEYSRRVNEEMMER